MRVCGHGTTWCLLPTAPLACGSSSSAPSRLIHPVPLLHGSDLWTMKWTSVLRPEAWHRAQVNNFFSDLCWLVRATQVFLLCAMRIGGVEGCDAASPWLPPLPVGWRANSIKASSWGSGMKQWWPCDGGKVAVFLGYLGQQSWWRRH